MRTAETLDQQVAAEIARRAARRLEVLAAERPDLLADRLAGWQPTELRGLLELTRLPDPLAEREPRHRHVGVSGVDDSTQRLVSGDAAEHDPRHSMEYVQVELPDLDDDDLVSACQYVPETLPGYVLG